MDVKSERCRQRPISPRQAGQDSTSDSAGDGRAWNRPPRTARPHSCLEGRLKDQWLQTFNDLQMNDLHQYVQKNYTAHSESPSLVTSSQSSLESRYSGSESKERVRIKTGPSTQKAKVCFFAPVRIGWLPLQRHVLNNQTPNDGTTCKVKLKPPITPVLSCGSVKANGSAHGERTTGRGVSGMSGANALQGDGIRKATLTKRDRDTAHERSTSMHNTSCDRILWQTPVHRRGSVPQVSLLTPSTTGSRTSPKNSSSISSITITSRKVTRSSSLPDTSLFGQDRDKESSLTDLNNHIVDMNTSFPTKVIPQRKALIVKITEQKEDMRRFLQPGADICPNNSFTSSRTTGEHTFSPFSSRWRSDLTATNLSRAKNQPLNVTRRNHHVPQSHAEVPSFPTTQDPQIPSELQSKATITKVQEERDTFSRAAKNRRRNVAYRHSFSGLEVTDMEPQLNIELMLHERETQVSCHKAKLFKSTASFQCANGAHVDYLRTSRGFQPQTPASCYAGLFSPVEPSTDGSQDAAVHSAVLPHGINIDPAYSAASSLNRCSSTDEEAGSHDKIYPRTQSSASDKGQRKMESGLLRNQPLTLIKVPDRSTHETYDAIVARNAAAIITSIKVQSEQKKRIQSSGNTDGERDSASLSKTVGTFST